MTQNLPVDTPPPRFLQARHIGALIPDPFEATVLSVHTGVVNLLLPDGVLVSLLRDPGDMTALAIHVPELEAALCASLSFHRRGTMLKAVPAPDAARGVTVPVSVSLGQGRTFTGRPLRGGLLTGAGEALRSAVLRRSGEEGLATLLGRPTNAFARHAAKALAEGPGGLPKLVGLGIGFTPSGDDFLTGYLMASDLWSRSRRLSSKAEAALDDLPAAIEGRLASTTPGGRTLLYLALRGSYPCYLLRFWRGLRGLRGLDGSEDSDTDEAAVDETVRMVAEHGETSGLDAATGFVWYLLTSRTGVI